MAEKIKFTDNDVLEAMHKSVNESLNIDEMHVTVIKNIEENEMPTKWNGAYIDYNGLDVLNLKNPIFDK